MVYYINNVFGPSRPGIFSLGIGVWPCAPAQGQFFYRMTKNIYNSTELALKRT